MDKKNRLREFVDSIPGAYVNENVMDIINPIALGAGLFVTFTETEIHFVAEYFGSEQNEVLCLFYMSRRENKVDFETLESICNKYADAWLEFGM